MKWRATVCEVVGNREVPLWMDHFRWRWMASLCAATRASLAAMMEFRWDAEVVYRWEVVRVKADADNR